TPTELHTLSLHDALPIFALKPDYVCLKDPGGLLTPERSASLVKVLQENAPGIPIELHVHCTTGLGPLCALEAIKLGVQIVDTSRSEEHTSELQSRGHLVC